jgi:hypothetical protein
MLATRTLRVLRYINVNFELHQIDQKHRQAIFYYFEYQYKIAFSFNKSLKKIIFHIIFNKKENAI